MLLLPTLIKSEPSRIVNVSSFGHNFTCLFEPNLDKINDEEGYMPSKQYTYTKVKEKSRAVFDTYPSMYTDDVVFIIGVQHSCLC